VEVVVESDIDLRSAWGVPTDTPPGFTTVSYTTTLTTPSAPERVQALAAYAEAHSPSRDDLVRPLSVQGRLVIRPPVTASASPDR
jgi:hypothetical protein